MAGVSAGPLASTSAALGQPLQSTSASMSDTAALVIEDELAIPVIPDSAQRSCSTMSVSWEHWQSNILLFTS